MTIFLSRFVRCTTVLFLLLILVSMGAIREPHWLTAKAVQCPPITITPTKLADGTTGVSYSQNVNATGGGGRYSFVIIANSLPPGLGINASSGVISGIPTTTGSFSFLLRVTDGASGCFATRAYTVDVNCGPISFYPPALPGAVAGTFYSQAIGGSGGRSPYVFSVSSGSLPTGLSLDSNSGRISGTPTGNAIWVFDISVTDANPCTSTRRYAIEVTCPVLTVNPASLPTGTVGVAYNQTLSTTGGSGPYSYGTQASALPPGLSLTTSGTLSGTPTTPGIYSFAVRSNGSNGCFGERSYSVVINQACPTITVNPASLPVGQVGLFYDYTFTASGGVAPYSFRISAGAIPTGMSFVNGHMAGAPAVAGSFAFSISATDVNGCLGERAYTVVVNTPSCPALVMNPQFLPVPTVGTFYSQTFSATGGTAPYTFSISAGVLTSGLTLSSNGNLSGTATSTGSFSFTVRATDSSGCSVERSFVQGVLSCGGITFSPTGTGVPSARVGQAYSLTFTGSGGTAPYTFRLGNQVFLPPGLTLSPAGVLSGTPTTGGNYTFLLVVESANGCVGQTLLFLNIDDPSCPDIFIAPSFLTAMVVGVPYSQGLSASGGTGSYSFALDSGSLPPGLTIAANGTLAGTPTTAGTYGFTVRATDASGCAGIIRYGVSANNASCPSITLNPTSSTLPAGTTGTALGQLFSATGGASPYTFRHVLGTLPAGLSLALDGNLTGTPTTPGASSFTVRAIDANGCTAERTYLLAISASTCSTISLNPATLPSGVNGTSYSQTINATGGVAPYSFTISAGALPNGLSLAANGSITGSPSVSGSFSFTVKATDASGCNGERSYSLLINNPACPTVSLSPTSLPTGTNGSPYSQAITATGGTGPYSFSISSGTLPNGLSLSANGSIAGSPTVSGSFSFTVKATDANGCTGERSYSLLINNPACPTVSLSPTSLPPGTSGSPYSQPITATGGTGPYSFSISNGTLPTGLSLASNGNLTGSPATTGSFSFTVRATDGNLCNGERSYGLAIAPSLVTSVSAASFAPSGPLAPESIVAAFGLNLAANTEAALTQPLPTLLAGVSLKIRDSAGIERLAPLYFVSSRQVNYQVPAGTSLGSATLTILNEGGLTNASVMGAGSIDVAPVAPGVFSADAQGSGLAAAQVFRVKSNGAGSYEAVARYDAAQSRFVAEPIDFGPVTDQVFLVLYGTGFKFRSALSSVSCSVGGINSEVLYAGEVPGYVGLEQLNARLSRNLAGRGEVEVIIRVDGKQANTVRVAFR